MSGLIFYDRQWRSATNLAALTTPFTPPLSPPSVAWLNSIRMIWTSSEFLEHVKSICLNWRLLPDLCDAQKEIRDLRWTCPLVVTATQPAPTAPGPTPGDPYDVWPETQDFILEDGQPYRVRRTLVGFVIALNHVWLVRRYIDDLEAKTARKRFPYKLERSPDFEDYLAFAACDGAVYRMCMLFEVVDAFELPKRAIRDPAKHTKLRKDFEDFRHHWTHAWGRYKDYEEQMFFNATEYFLKTLEGELWGGFGFICDCYPNIIQVEIARLYGGGEELDPVACGLTGETIRIEGISEKPKPKGEAGQ